MAEELEPNQHESLHAKEVAEFKAWKEQSLLAKKQTIDAAQEELVVEEAVLSSTIQHLTVRRLSIVCSLCAAIIL
jgi:hypothetical protein|eukprot:COSAG06_NODE_585_length_14005_cov_13.777938_3_plen_75_part_00